tara:strand:+ start:88 stop:279 length:192 start_codon:yes stop_codon:yes gene_type:complete
MQKESENALLEEMKSIKMLMILQLLAGGTKQSDIALMLGVSDATVSRLIPKAVKVSVKGNSNG